MKGGKKAKQAAKPKAATDIDTQQSTESANEDLGNPLR